MNPIVGQTGDGVHRACDVLDSGLELPPEIVNVRVFFRGSPKVDDGGTDTVAMRHPFVIESLHEVRMYDTTFPSQLSVQTCPPILDYDCREVRWSEGRRLPVGTRIRY